MTHPLDRVYQFATPAQWGSGWSVDLRRGAEGGLVTPGWLRAERLCGTTIRDHDARLALDPAGRPLWLRPDGTVLRLAGEVAVELARLAPGAASRAVRLLWGQRVGWLVADGSLIRFDTATGDETGTFARPGWEVLDAVTDSCDGVIAVEIRRASAGSPDAPDTLRLRRIRDDGVVAPRIVEHALPQGRSIRAARIVHDGAVVLVTSAGPDAAWQRQHLPLDGSTPRQVDFPASSVETPGGAVALSADGRLTLASADRTQIFAVAETRIEPAQAPDFPGGFGHITDLLEDGESLLAATTTGLYRLCQEADDSPARQAIWISPVLRSPLGERSGWQRADLTAAVPEGGEVTIAARGFDRPEAARAARADLDANTGAALTDHFWDDPGTSRHYGIGSETRYRHYLGEIDSEYLLLRISVSVPACRGTARLSRLRVLYPDRSLIEALPAIYQDGGRSERQLRRALAGLQATIDDIDDRISDGPHRIDPDRADALWSGFLMHWLGHRDLARLPLPERRAVLKALPELMQLRGTEAGLAALFDILAPGAYAIEDSGARAPDWLLAPANDPAAARLGRNTRAGHTAPVPLRLGGCTGLGVHVLGQGCDETGGTGCSATVTVRIFGGAAHAARLAPFTDPIRRLFAPAHTRLAFVYGDHRPATGLGTDGQGPGLGALTLAGAGSRALGDWTLPGHDTPDHPEDDAVLDHATLNGTLTLT